MCCTAPARSRRCRHRSRSWPGATRRGGPPAGGGSWRATIAGVLGFGYYGQYRSYAAYRHAAEDSIYVRETVRGQGVGKAIVAALLAHAAARGFAQMLAVIGDSENAGSIGMHASLGFAPVGTLRKVGCKLGRWLDVVIMQKPLP